MYSFLLRIWNKAENIFSSIQYKKISKSLSFDSSSQFILTGDPRGGTTWLAEIIQSIPKTALVWEPLWLSQEKTFRNHNFSYRQFIPENAPELEIKSSFENLFSGKILNPFLCQFNSPTELKTAEQLLIKFCRANQLLPWLTRAFDFKYAPIYIIRHPCAVIASQLKQGGWDHVSDKFHIPYDKPYPEFYSQHEDFLKKINSKIKVLAATWCLCNSVPLKHPKNNNNWITITYESLILEGEKQLKRIEKRWGIKIPETSYQKLQEPSATTVKGSPILERNGSQLEYWKKQLSEQDIAEIMSVLNYFKIDLYNSGFLPTKSFE